MRITSIRKELCGFFSSCNMQEDQKSLNNPQEWWVKTVRLWLFFSLVSGREKKYCALSLHYILFGYTRNTGTCHKLVIQFQFIRIFKMKTSCLCCFCLLHFTRNNYADHSRKSITFILISISWLCVGFCIMFVLFDYAHGRSWRQWMIKITAHNLKKAVNLNFFLFLFFMACQDTLKMNSVKL